MVTENVNVRFTESGARVIKRRIDEIGQASDRATRGIFLFQRALFVLGGAGFIRGLTNLSDSLTNIENRLGLTSSSLSNLEAVQDRLVESANRSRSAFEATADVYSRIALSTRTLGVSQRQVLNVTETLQQASILSGASAREANAALVQLGQGLASDRLSGDELRSVLEQLPFVADIIVDYLNQTQQFGQVTRGTLRELGRQGELTSEIVFRAIESAQARTQALFDDTNPTIEQAFSVARNNVLSLIDAFDDATNASSILSRGIIVISENLDLVARSAVFLTSVLLASFSSNVIGSLIAYRTSLITTGQAMTRLAAIRTASASREALQATTTARDTAARLANIQARRGQVAATLASAQAEYTEATAAFQNGRARSAQTGQFIASQAARDRLTAATIRLTAAERANNIVTARTATLRTAATAATNAATAANVRLTGAVAAQTGFLARLGATFPLLAGGVRALSVAFTGLFTIMLANPISILIAGIAALIGLFFIFGDRISVARNGLVTLRSLGVAAFQLLYEAIEPVVNIIRDDVIPIVTDLVDKWVRGLRTIFDNAVTVFSRIVDILTLPGRIVIGVVAGIVAAWDLIPNSAAVAIDALVGFFVDGFERIGKIAAEGINAVISSINSLAGTRAGNLLGFEGIDLVNAPDLGNLRTNLGQAGGSAADAFTDAFTNAIEDSRPQNIIRNAYGAILDRATFNELNNRADRLLIQGIEDRQIDTPGTPAPPASGSGGSGSATNDLLKEAEQLFQSTRLESERYAAQLERINLLYERGYIDTETYTRATRNLAQELTSAGRFASDVADTIKSSFENLFQNMFDGSQKAGEAITDLGKKLAAMAAQQSVFRLLARVLPGTFGEGGFIDLLANADGNAFSNGRVQAFASGGVVNSPTLFGMKNGLGLMGEAGPEAILPLTRVGGKLGVQSSGGGGNQQIVQVIDQRTSSSPPVETSRSSVNGKDYVTITIKKAISNGQLDKEQRTRFGSSVNKVKR